jgi:hypothetical protein
MRSWWRSLHGDDSQLDDKHLREMAGTFSRRLHACSCPIASQNSQRRLVAVRDSEPPFSSEIWKRA